MFTPTPRGASTHGLSTTPRRWLALDPLHEPAHRALMHFFAWSGDRTGALQQYQECVRILHAEMGVVPDPETTALHELIRAGNFIEPTPAPSAALCPQPATPAYALYRPRA